MHFYLNAMRSHTDQQHNDYEHALHYNVLIINHINVIAIALPRQQYAIAREVSVQSTVKFYEISMLKLACFVVRENC
jgi:hypothetical protein